MEREYIANQIYTITGFNSNACRLMSSLFKDYRLCKLRYMQLEKLDSRSIFFLYSGILHFYQSGTKDGDRDKTKTRMLTLGIYKPKDFFQLPLASNSPAPHYKLSAIRSSRFFVAYYKDIEELSAKNSKIMDLYNAIVQHFLQKTFNHLYLLQTPTALGRFKMIRNHFGKHILEIPYQYQASFMGISRKHLSRILLSLRP